MGQTIEQYERDGYCIADEQIAPDDVLEKALQGMVAVRDGNLIWSCRRLSIPGMIQKCCVRSTIRIGRIRVSMAW